MKRRSVAIGLSVVLFVCLVGWYTVGAPFYRRRSEAEFSQTVAATAEANLQVGMTRQQSRRFVKDAWRQYYCYDGLFELYLFGSRDPEAAMNIFLRFDGEGPDAPVTQVGHEETYRLHLYQEPSCKITEK